MKKLLTMFIVFVLSIICSAFVGCSNGIEGTYKFKSMSGNMHGIEICIESEEEFFGVMKIPENFIILTLDYDYTYILTTSADDDSVEVGKWKIEDGNLKLIQNGKTSDEFRFKGKDLIFNLELEGIDFEVVLSK